MNMFFESGHIEKSKSADDISVWVAKLMQEGTPENPAKNIIVEDNTYWEEGKVSPEVMDLIAKTEAVQKSFEELRKERGEMGYKDIRHMIRVAELIRVAIDTGEIVLTADDRRDLLVAALCHDEGKTDEEVREILENKKGKDLLPEERKIMQKHVRASYEFLKAHGEERAGRIALCHHEVNGEEILGWAELHQHTNNEQESYPRSGKERREQDVAVEVDQRTGERREEDNSIKRLGNFLSMVDKIEANGSRDRLYNKGRKAQELKDAKEKALRKFNSPEERLMISILEKIDPNNLTQRANEEYLQMMEAASTKGVEEME